MIVGCLWGPEACDFALVVFNNSVEIEAEVKVGHGVCLPYLHST